MVSLCTLVSSGVAEQQLYECLTLEDLLRYEASGNLARSQFDMSSCWSLGLERALPMFDLSAMLEKEPLTKKVMVSLFLGLSEVTVAGDSRVRIKDLQHAQSLIAAVGRARKTAETHIANGGHATEVQIGMVEFDSIKKDTGTAGSVTSDGLRIPLHWNNSHAGGGSSLGAEYPSKLEIAVSNVGSSVSVQIKNPWADVDDLFVARSTAEALLLTSQNSIALRRMFVDVAAISNIVKLSLRDMMVRPDGSHSKGIGLSTTLGSPGSVKKALQQGLICVFGVRDASVPSCTGVSQGVHAMHIDARR
eukprot:TRINITY_DN4374_c0_g1_i2.p1 TRINITY_DN4374_c0_g1~~TRINITY_DN4374_c0_g1_i2.p1  ORF type:complete len:305 (-),score=36.65 TRINITY_DN4374_c0_g1_i2:803-1717(-)